jgi:hypothetical protein
MTRKKKDERSPFLPLPRTDTELTLDRDSK